MASPKMKEAEFWESLENMFGQKFPVDPQVRHVIDMAIKESRNQNPEERAKVINAAVYLAHDIVIVGLRGKSNAGVAFKAMKTAEEFIREKLQEAKEGKVPIDEETESKTETKQTTEGNISPGDFPEQFQKVKMVERKGGLKEKPTEEKVDYVVNDGVINIYLNIIEKFVEVNRIEIFEDYDYQKLRDEGYNFLDQESGLPTFIKLRFQTWDYNIDRLKKDIGRLKLPNGETHSRECNEAFCKARDKLLSEAINSIFYAFEKFKSTTGVEETDLKELVRDQLLEDPKIKELGKKIENIIYPDTEMSLGVFVDSQALKLWEEEGGYRKEFNDFAEEVKRMFQILPEFVVFWGEWAYNVSKKLKPKASSVK